jgi:hypothetical protein
MNPMNRTSSVRGAATAALLAATVAAGSWLHGAPAAVAPEPAKLRAGLASTSGATADAYYLNSPTQTRVVYYTGSWTTDGYGPPAGTPCSPFALAADATTSRVIQVQGTWRRCV